MEDEPSTVILDATYRALCEHGYADLTLQDIADEADTSEASIHYHYESRDQLFLAFLDLLYERHTDRVVTITGDTPRERLDSLLAELLTDDGGTACLEFRTAMLEVSAQAPYDAAVRERLTEFDERIDPSLAAEVLVTTITGAQTRQVAVDHPPDPLYTTTTRYAETHLFADDPAEVTQ